MLQENERSFRRLELEKCDKRGTIIQAALELVAEHGFHGAPMAMIAERAGVGAGTIYRYFENKDILITGIHAELERRFLSRIMEHYPSGKPVRERFVHITSCFIRYCISWPMDFRFFEQFHNSPYGVDHRRDKLFGNRDDVIKGLFNEALQQQIMKDLPLSILFALAFGPLLTICRDNNLGFIKLDDLLITQTVEACWDAVKR